MAHTRRTSFCTWLAASRPRRLSLRSGKGFTLIEVLIVLAIAALLLLIVFMIVPQAQRNARNYQRKRFVNLTATQLDQYYQSHGLTYPDTPTQMCDFINNYLKVALSGAPGSCSATYNGTSYNGVPRGCVLVSGGIYAICYHSRPTSEHAYLGPLDEISLQLGHWCNTDPVAFAEPAGNPITAGASGGPDNEVRRYVVWTRMEGIFDYCVDNFPD